VFPSPFDYVVASSVEEAVSLLQHHGEEAKLLAGGHSLLPMMKLRLAAPSVLIDIGRIPGLAGVQANGAISLGPTTTYTTVMDSEELARLCPLLAETAAQVGDMQVRNRGTVGGSVAHADPASDMPAAMLALEATFTARGPGGERSIAASDFFQGLFMTALQPDEVLTRISIARPPQGTGMAYEKFRNPASGYAIVGVAAVAALAGDGTLSDVRVAITGAGAQPVRATAVEAALRGQAPDDAALAAAAEHATEGLQLMSDIHASEDYRAHLTRVFTRRALKRALERAQA
jgi:aerobic carbon-monoxide dehydrogenase medium subunit